MNNLAEKYRNELGANRLIIATVSRLFNRYIFLGTGRGMNYVIKRKSLENQYIIVFHHFKIIQYYKRFHAVIEMKPHTS